MDPSLPPELQAILWSLAFDVVVVAVAVVAILTTIKHVGRILDKGATQPLIDRPWAQAVLEFAPLALGAALALVPGLFDGFEIALRAVFGLIAGYASPGIYGHLKKRLPGLMLSKDATARQGGTDG